MLVARPLQHSFSALSTFEQCPKKYYHLKVARDYKDSRSSVGDYGIAAHKFFESRLLNGTELPMDLAHHEPVLSMLAKAKGMGLPEQKLAINKDFKPTGFFDDDVWLRAVIDYVKIEGDTAVIIDHKFGKMKSVDEDDHFSQVELCAAVFSCFKPEIKNYRLLYYWAKVKKTTRKNITSADIPEIWSKLIGRFDNIEQASKTTNYPAKKNGLCEAYCPVLACPHNGKTK